MIDTNVSLSRWPFRRLAGDETPDLVAMLQKRQVTQAWTGSFDGILHKDIRAVNARLAADCRIHGKGILAPFGSINPKLPDWREDVRRCREEHRMQGIRLHPNYHGYTLTDPVFLEFLHLAGERALAVQIAASMEDTRTQPPLMRVPPVDLAPLPELIGKAPAVQVMLLNWRAAVAAPRLKPLADAGVYFDISTVEGLEGVARLLERVSPERVVFGSNFPLFYYEAALLKVQESGVTGNSKSMLLGENARRFLRRAAPGGSNQRL